MAEKRKLRILIVDDEQLARQNIRQLLEKYKDVTVIGECADGESAVEKICEFKPDLVTMDIKMPGMDGFEVLELVPEKLMPHIIFVTAYDEYALKAFEFHAVDYLLKPFDDDRFFEALDRVKTEVLSGESGSQQVRIQSLISELAGQGNYLSRMIIKKGDRYYIIQVGDIQWIEAAGYYMRLHAGSGTYLIRKTMKSLAKRLDPGLFFRIHRSYMVNLDFVREIQTWFHGDYIVILKDGKKLPVSKMYKKAVFARLKP